MKKVWVVIVGFFSFSHAFPQTHVEVKTDSVKIASGELTIQNGTKNVNVFLFNNGDGVTSFRRGAVKLNDTTYIIGADTLHIPFTAVSQTFQQTLDVTNGNFLNHDNIIKVNNHNLVFDTADNFTIKAQYPNIWHPFPDATSSNPATFLVLKNDEGETPHPEHGAMISGSASGGAVVFNNDFTDASNRSLRFGLVDNNGTFSNMMKFNYSAFGNKIIAPLTQSPQINSIVIQHGDTLYKTSLSQLSDSLSNYFGGGLNTNFANTDLTATGNRVHDFGNHDLTIGNVGTGYFMHGATDWSTNYSVFSVSSQQAFMEVGSGEHTEKASTISVGSESAEIRVDNGLGGNNNTSILEVTPAKTILRDVSGNNTSPRVRINIGAVPNYANNAAAIAAGLVVGDIYRNGDVLQIVH